MLPLPLANLNGVGGMVGGEHLDHLAATDSLHSVPGLELASVGSALAHRWELHSTGAPRLRG
jgi:hypothetical protein